MQSMENIKEIIAKNLVALRKFHHITQAELAEKLNFSDKAVSRWEKGEVVPDVETLNNISEVYGIQFEKLFDKDLVLDQTNTEPEKKSWKRNKFIISFLAEMLVCFLAVVGYVTVRLAFNVSCWQIFIWAVVAMSIVALVFSWVWNKRVIKFLSMSLLVWSLILAFYLQFIDKNWWLLFILGIPLQIAILLWACFKKNKKQG